MANQAGGRQGTPDDEAFTDERLPLIDLEREGQRPPSRRKRLLQVGAALAALVITVVTFHGMLAPARPVAPTPTPYPTAPPLLLLINSNVTGAAVSINGKRHATLPMLIPYDGAKHLDVTVEAPPFQPITCHLPIFDNHPQSGCQQGDMNGSVAVTLNGISGAPSYFLVVAFTDASLPIAQQAQINAVVTQALETPQQTTVPAGAYYATSFTGTNSPNDQLTSQRATVPLQANITLLPYTNVNFSECNGFICARYEPISGLSGPGDGSSTLPAHLWLIDVPVALRWQFARASGQVVSSVSFSSPLFLSLVLSYGPEAGWQLATLPDSGGSISDQLTNLSCNIGVQILMDLAGSNSNGVGGPGSPHNQAIEGCEPSLQSNSGTNLGTFLWRFGVLLAADANAHALLPALPMAPPDELAAAGV